MPKVRGRRSGGGRPYSQSVATAAAQPRTPDADAAHSEYEERVTPLELFFDLVFVFAFTQVTGYIAGDPSWEGLARGLLILGALWWAWVAYAWLTNSYNPEEGRIRLAFFTVMATMLVVSLAVPEAFDANGVLFGCAYFVVRAAHLAVYALAARDEPDVFDAVLRLTPSSVIGPGLLIVAGFLDGTAQAALWIAALTIDYSGPYVIGSEGWRVSPGHFAERHGLIVIIALGESIVALSTGAGAVDAGVVLSAVLAFAVAASLWWTYFDVVAVVAERKLREATGAARNAMARDSYSYIHLAMIAGIILFATGVKKTLGDVGEPLKAVPAAGLCGGVALYLLGHVAFRLRNVQTLATRRVVVAAMCTALIPVALEIPALLSLACVAAFCIGLTIYEVIRYRGPRSRLRASVAAARGSP
jgi:low temperature requirement protein LtrA